MTANKNHPHANPVAFPHSVAFPTTKSARLLAMLRTSDGASIEDISDTLGWQQHSARAALTGLRKKGHDITRGKQGSVTIYRIVL